MLSYSKFHRLVVFVLVARLAAFAGAAGHEPTPPCDTYWGPDRIGDPGVTPRNYSVVNTSNMDAHDYLDSGRVLVARTAPDGIISRYAISLSSLLKEPYESAGKKERAAIACTAETYKCNTDTYLRCALKAKYDRWEFYEVLSTDDLGSSLCTGLRDNFGESIIERCGDGRTCTCYRLQTCEEDDCKPGDPNYEPWNEPDEDEVFEVMMPPDPGTGSGGSDN